jgi:regulator of protease activity HflC (stomatin/prohibitin superfamily)
MLASAEAQATQIKGMGEAEAAKSLSAFQKNPELASFLFRLNALEGALKERSILVFDQHTPPFDLFRGVSTNMLTK